MTGVEGVRTEAREGGVGDAAGDAERGPAVRRGPAARCDIACMGCTGSEAVTSIMSSSEVGDADGCRLVTEKFGAKGKRVSSKTNGKI